MIHLTSGVPQGSHLGPILFAYFMDSLNPIHSNVEYKKYADDLSVLYMLASADIQDLQDEVQHIVSWCHQNGMSLNMKKTKIMHYGSPSVERPFSVGGNEVEVAKSLKLLGLTITSNLKWKEHIDACSHKATRALFALLQLRRTGVSPSILIMVYQATVRSILAYSYPAFCNLTQNDLKKLVRIEKWAIKIINKAPPVDLQLFLNKQCTTLATKVWHDDNHPLRQLVVHRPTTITRRSYSLAPPLTRSSRRQNSFIKFFNL